MPNKDVPHISLGNWISGGSLLYIPPIPKKTQSKAKASPKVVELPKEEPKAEEPPKEEEPPKDDAPATVSEGTDSPEDILKKAREIVAQAEAEAKKAEEEAKKMEDNENAKKAAEEEAAKKKADEEAAAKKKEEDEAAAKKKEEEDAAAAKKKEEDDAAARKKEEEDAAAKQKADDEDDAAKKKALDEKIELLKKEKELMEIEHQNKKLLHELAKEMALGEQTVHATRAVSVGRYCSICGRRRHEGECDDLPEPATASLPVVNVNVYGGAEDAVKINGDKDAVGSVYLLTWSLHQLTNK